MGMVSANSKMTSAPQINEDSLHKEGKYFDNHNQSKDSGMLGESMKAPVEGVPNINPSSGHKHKRRNRSLGNVNTTGVNGDRRVSADWTDKGEIAMNNCPSLSPHHHSPSPKSNISQSTLQSNHTPTDGNLRTVQVKGLIDDLDLI
ncbi:unnamed protein product [Owenia fusiformis]|uniref:Uncharacterized protein n=1 Tax=Owenia fusiformis TaxID=6347 RepID=A0A8J1UI25_OWEFU|nr:unnamed protein product [Owenia fusiformis]